MKKLKGFTLTELMVVVAIISILATVALPAYNDYVVRGKLTEAITQLAGMRVKLEQYYQDNRTYVGGCAAGTVAPLPTANDAKYFTFACPTLTLSAFQVEATGIATQGTGGFTYTVDQSNNKQTSAAPAGWGTAPINCWVTKRGGAC